MNNSEQQQFSSDRSAREKVYFLLSLVVPFTMIFLYVSFTAADVPFRDDMYLIKGSVVEKYCAGSLTFDDLWRPAAKIRVLGYNVLQVINVQFFNMNAKLIALLIPFLILISAVLVYREYRRSLATCWKPQHIAVSFILLSLIMFNLVQWEALTFDYSFVFQQPMPFLMASFISLELFLATGAPQYGIVALIMTALVVLVFGGTSVFSAAPALVGTFACYVFTRRANLTKYFWLRTLLIISFLGLFAFLYMHNIRDNDYFPGASSDAGKVLQQPQEAFRFLLAAFGASVIGVNAAQKYFSFSFMVALGTAVVVLYGMGLFFFIRFRVYQKTYLPFFLILLPLFHLIFMTLGRFGYGMDYGMSSRYTAVSVYGLVGVVWMLMAALAAKAKRRFLLLVPMAVIFTGLLLTAATEWKIQPYRKAYFQDVRKIALHVETATDEELAKFEERPKLVRESLLVLKKHCLNVYRSFPPDM